MTTRTRLGCVALLMFASSCTSPPGRPASTSTQGVPASPTTAPAFIAEPFQPATWPIASERDLQAYRAHPSTIPWATSRVAVAEHFARQVLGLSDVHGVAHCVAACTNVDLYVGGRHVGGVVLAAERDEPSTVYSAAGAYTPDIQISDESSLSDPAIVSGSAHLAFTPLQVSLRSLTGRVLATAPAMTASDRTWTAVLSPLPKRWSHGVLVVTRSIRGTLSQLFAEGVQEQLPAAPTVHVPCKGTDLTIVRPRNFHVGYTGDSSFGFYVANTGEGNCVLSGYAALRFTAGSKLVPFKILHGSGMGYFDPGPHPVTLRPGGTAVFAVDKYRCDGGFGPVSTRVRITLPGLSAVSLPIGVAYCLGGPAGDTLTLTALAATRAELYRTR
jgi:hypothetical protein